MGAAAAAVALSALLLTAAAAAAPPGTSISNRAELRYVAGSGPTTIVSNSVDVVVVPPPSRATLTLLRSDASGSLGVAQPTQCTSSGTPLPLPPPLGSNGQPLALGQTLALSVTATVHGGEAVFLELADADRNRDATVIDSVELTVTAAGGDRETIVLAETGVDSGRFAGYVQTRAVATLLGDCTLQVERDGELTARYADPLDAADTATAAAIVDPFGLVFDSQTGAPVDGARVRLVGASAGTPADVRGDDGVSAYPAELITGQSVTDAGGTVYAFPPGVFRFPLVAAGDYRLVVEPPARYSAPSRVPEAQLQALPGAPYTLLPASFGGALTVAGQIAPAVDIPLDPTGGALFVEKTTALDVAAIGDFVPYTVTVRNAGEAAALTNVVVTDELPSGLRYQPGSTRSDAGAAEPEISSNGRTLTFRLPKLEPRRSVALKYVAVIVNGAAGSTLVNRATARADGGSESNTASVAVLLREELFSSAALLLGRVVAGSCGTTVDAGEGVSGVRVYLEDGRYAVTDDEGKYHFEGVTPGSHVVQLDTITLPEELEPLRCDARVRSAGNATSQFVDLRGGALGTADFVVAQRAAPVGEARLALATVAPRALASARPAGIAAALEPEIDVATIEPQLAIVQPSEDFAPPVPTVRVSVAHLPDQQARLTVNGRRVSELNFDGTEPNVAKTAALSRWRGVDLVAGDNRLVATVVDAGGAEVAVLERTVRYGGGGVRAELVASESRLTADGRTQPVIAVRVFDASGQPARPGTLGAYSVDPPYRTWWEVETLHDNPLLVESRREPTFAVEEDGLVRLLLEPTAQTGAAVVRLRFNERQEQELRVRLEPEQRDWILVGLAEGTTSYDKLEAALQPLESLGVDDGYSNDGRLAFFAKGRIKGSTLLTIAFDSERDRPLVEDRLFGAIEPDRYYTLYGDAVEQRFEAATTRKLYLKIERREFAALFGDFETGFTITELGRYSRSLTGLKADYGGERFTVNAFAADNREQYGRDELPGDGTSGPYQLGRAALVANSDRVRIEVRDRIRSEVVVESHVLTRFIDYSLDYFTGTLTLKAPVMSRDAAFNPVYIVAEYETLDTDAHGTTAGARTTARLAGDKLELGATLIDETATAGDTRLTGTDLRFRPTGALELRAEVAQTSSDDPLRAASASAYLAEIEHVTERLDLQAYVREQETGFGVGQQLRTEAGTRKVGVDARSALTELWTTRGEAFRQTNLATGADRELVAAEARRETDDATASVGLKRVVDELPLSGVQRSELVSVGGSLDVLHDRVTLRALTEQSLEEPAASLDFPERTALGLDYHLSGATTLFAEVEDAEGTLLDSTMTRIGVRSTPWSGSQLSSSVNREFSEHGPRVFANVGLTQSFKVGESWAMDAGVDRSDTLAGATAERFNANVPLVAGSVAGDFLATFFGAQYRADVWTITSRVERRDSELAERRSFTSGFFREPIAGRALSVTTRWLDNEMATGAGRTVDARVSYAFRPRDSKLIVLERLDLAQDERVDLATSFATTRFVNNVNLHWQFDNRFEFGTQLGARYTKSTIDGERYAGWSTLLGLDLRRDLTRVLDFGVHGTRLDSEAGGTSERSYGVDVGITSARNLWISVGYNFEGFRDEHFDASRYTADGPYVRFRFKIDQDTFKDLDLSGLRPGP